MAYLDLAHMTRDTSLMSRLAAAAAEQEASGSVLDPAEPEPWAEAHRWELCAAPGWADAWASAVANGVPDPGADPGVITDGMMLAQVQAVLAG
jgi:hypothetical protein